MNTPINTIQSSIKALVAFGERQGAQETAAANWIKKLLEKQGIAYISQSFETDIPVVTKEELIVDGDAVACKATCFVSGEIRNNHALVSSLISSQLLIDQPNINFNPVSDGISRGNHYFAPSVAIRRSDVQKVIDAHDVFATVEVEKMAHISENILVGNTENPKHIMVCHYDSIGPGATDNASGTALLLALVLHNPELLNNTLFLIGGNEEVSYDYPLYWGHGYRAFAESYESALAAAEHIYVVDCVGDGPVTFDQDIETVRLCFPLKNLEASIDKITAVYGDFDALMRVYQSEIDVPEVLSESYLIETYERMREVLSLNHLTT